MITYRMAGLTQLLELERTFGAKTQGILTEHLHHLGEQVMEDVRDRYAPYSIEGAYGVVEKVFVSGLWVVQTLPKSRDKNRQRPNFGPLMWRKAFVPAVRDNEARIGIVAEQAVQEARELYWDRA
jgi:hypothetical protein